MKPLLVSFVIAFAVLSSSALAEDWSKTSLMIVACQVDDLTGTRTPPGDPGSIVMPTPKWRDLELHVVNGELQCKLVPLMNLQDASIYSDKATQDMVALNPNFGDNGQCARVSSWKAAQWEEDNNGWGVVAVGCPRPIMNAGADGVEGTADDFQIGWAAPDCPTYFPGTTVLMKCKFTPSLI